MLRTPFIRFVLFVPRSLFGSWIEEQISFAFFLYDFLCIINLVAFTAVAKK